MELFNENFDHVLTVSPFYSCEKEWSDIIYSFFYYTLLTTIYVYFVKLGVQTAYDYIVSTSRLRKKVSLTSILLVNL